MNDKQVTRCPLLESEPSLEIFYSCGTDNEDLFETEVTLA
jgi:hypothetical protein